MKIAVLDSGIEPNHPLLNGLTLADDLAVIDDGLQLTTVSGEGRDVFGHGTAIASIIRRVAPDAEIEFERIAVTPEQISQWDLPTRPIKQSDTRSRNFGDISVELDASVRPSGLNTTLSTHATWPDSASSSCPVVAFHNRTVVSSEQDTSDRPLELNATLLTPAV